MRHTTLHWFLTCWPLPFAAETWRWYRRWQGGHWERWYIEVCHADLWLDMPEGCYFGDEWRRPGTGRGTPTCETWP